MAHIICVTCSRDFYDFKRQLKSFERYLQPEHTLTYIVEDSEPQSWLDQYNTFKQHITIQNSVDIILASDMLHERYNEIHGHIRQQLLKLVAASRSIEQECWIIDSKDFLIRPPTSDAARPRTPYIDNSKDTDPYFEVIDYYCKKFNFLEKTDLSPPWTPFAVYQKPVANLINLLGESNFIDWFCSHIPHSEFYLYQLYCHTNKITIDYSAGNNTAKLWCYLGKQATPEWLEWVKEYITSPEICWVSRHRWAHHSWDENMKEFWKNFLKQHNLAEYDEFNDTDIDQWYLWLQQFD